MTILSNLQFDLYLSHIKAQSRKRTWQVLAEDASALCDMSVESLLDVLREKEQNTISGIADGVAVLDIRSVDVKRPLLVLMTLEQPVDFESQDDKKADIIAAVISPDSYGPLHLQRLAGVTRLLRNPALCAALREARDPDSMRVLFSSQSQMIAA